ncbi:hypothetical protein EV127DRAFT_41327 [Xylaria flabelliformis]|nr:hypothetical protein EV127DRAFT_41327 [Xylaria flabelliformis]
MCLVSPPRLVLLFTQAAYLHGLLKCASCRASNSTTQQQFNANTDRSSYKHYTTSRLSRSIGSRAPQPSSVHRATDIHYQTNHLQRKPPK